MYYIYVRFSFFVDLTPFCRLQKSEPHRQLTPIAIEAVSAGFPSPADDYMDRGIDLNEELIHRPASTFFLRVAGNSMDGSGIHDGDLLVVDRSINPLPGHIVVAVLDGTFTLKRLMNYKGNLRLEAENPSYPPINLNNYGDVQIWGVATYSIHKTISSYREYNLSKLK